MKVRYIRMTILARSTTSTGDYVQLSEINLLDRNGNRFNWGNSTVTTSLTPQSGQDGSKLLDNNVDTKFCAAWNTAGCVITIDVPTYVDLSEYSTWNWYTADDNSSRDPKTYTLSVSRDGKKFTVVDSVNAVPTTTRKALAYTGSIDAEYIVVDTYAFDYTGGVQTTTLAAGMYRFKVYGAQGGYRSVSGNGGKGGYAQGILELSSSTNLFIYVGGSGNNGGFNGGGLRDHDLPGGGGASDIRIGTDSLYARVIVAGGGGSDGAANRQGGAGGGETGTNFVTSGYGTGGYGGTQTGNNGGSSWVVAQQSQGTSVQADCYAGFGFGGNGTSNGESGNGRGGSGGGGWYGGTGVYPDGGDDDKGGGGGSGYTYTSTTASNYPSGCLLNASYYLLEPYMAQGQREGDGYIEIEKLVIYEEKFLLTDEDDNVYSVGTTTTQKDVRRVTWNEEIYDKHYISSAGNTTISYNSGYTNYKYTMLKVEPNKKYRVIMTSTKSTLNRSFVRILGSNASIPLPGTGSYTGRIPFTDVSSFTSPFNFTVETQANEYYIYIFFAYNISGIVASDINVECYEIIDDIVVPTIVSGASASTITASLMRQYGQDAIYLMAHKLDISSIPSPKVYRWNEGVQVNVTSRTMAVPNAQVLSGGSFNLNDETIIGIDELTGNYNESLSIQYSYDNSSWSAKMSIANFNTNKDSIYNGLGASKMLYIKIWLNDIDAKFTKLTLQLTNPEE